jgi:acyl-coenzyme A thioesterase PaaI-like protein
MKELEQVLPVTNATVADAHAFMFAPWVRQLGLCDFEVREGYVRARLPERDDLKLVAGSICGQALMAAIDTLAALAMCTTDRLTKGTVNQHTQFLRPAKGGDLIVEVNVMRFGT